LRQGRPFGPRRVAAAVWGEVDAQGTQQLGCCLLGARMVDGPRLDGHGERLLKEANYYLIAQPVEVL
jgi:hypothetical protein